ncbi:MAG: histidine--tRNA ligase, partial [Blastocatellia bacterium]
FLPSDVRKRNYVIGIIKEVYESYGFEPLETPAVENLATLMGKYGDEGNQLIYKILKRGKKLEESLGSLGSLDSGTSETSQTSSTSKTELADLALRYDLTVPLARVVANNKKELPKFFKRYQIQPVWRADRPARGRFREFYQCDLDFIGTKSRVVEAELIAAASEVLNKLKFKDYVIRLNDRLLLDAVMLICQVENNQQGSVLVALDKLDKIGVEGVTLELRDLGLRTDSIEALLYWTTEKTVIGIDTRIRDFSSAITIKEAYDFLSYLYSNANFLPAPDEGKTKLDESVRRLKTILGNLSAILPEVRIRIDPSLARGLSYYTGTIMEINVPDLAGSLGGGGRYDGLIGMFGKEQIPACGFSLGLERILVVMDERGMFPPEIAESTPADVMVTIWKEESISESLKLASDLRAEGLRVTVYPEPDKLGKQIKYADSIKVPFVCVLGETELTEGKVTVKNMKTGEQKTVERSKIAENIKMRKLP